MSAPVGTVVRREYQVNWSTPSNPAGDIGDWRESLQEACDDAAALAQCGPVTVTILEAVTTVVAITEFCRKG